MTEKTIDLSVDVGGLRLRNPIMPASGTFAEGLDKVMDFDRLGAMVTKTITRELRAGNPLPRVVERPGSLINAIGIPSKGVDYFIELSIPGVAAIEANISCPNIEADGKAFAMRPDSTENVTRHLRKATNLPLWVKLTPNTGEIADVARAAESAGADAVVVANTILSMAIDLKTFKPCLGNIMGGLSGPAIKPIVLRQVFQCSKAVKVPIIGCGGVMNADDAAEYLLAGASAVQVGTATFIQPAAMTTIIEDLATFCQHRDIPQVSDLIGGALIEETDEPELAWVDPT